MTLKNKKKKIIGTRTAKNIIQNKKYGVGQ